MSEISTCMKFVNNNVPACVKHVPIVIWEGEGGSPSPYLRVAKQVEVRFKDKTFYPKYHVVTS